MAELRNPRRGEPLASVFTADGITAWNDAARDFQQRRLSQTFAPRAFSPSSVIIDVKNTTGNDLNQFEVVVLSSALFTFTQNRSEFLQRPAMKVIIPTTPSANPVAAVLLDPLADNAIGRATIMGLTPVQVVFDTGQSAYRWAELVNGVTANMAAKQYHGPARIVDREPLPSTLPASVWAYVILLPQPDTGTC